MRPLNRITKEIHELERHLREVEREYSFARGRMLYHKDGKSLRERMLYAGARLRMEELAEELAILASELDAIEKEIIRFDGVGVW